MDINVKKVKNILLSCSFFGLFGTPLHYIMVYASPASLRKTQLVLLLGLLISLNLIVFLLAGG